jgi:hypothetical protein
MRLKPTTEATTRTEAINIGGLSLRTEEAQDSTHKVGEGT